MTLIVTPGAADADAFVSLEDCDTYCTAQGLTDWTSAARSPPEDDEAAIRRATRWLSTAFTWKGYRTNGRDQSLAHPRVDLTDEEGEDIASDEIAIEIVQACCIAAAAERASPGILAPSVNLTERVKSERVGDIAVEYATASMSAEASRPVLLAVRDIVAGLICSTSTSLTGSTVRG